jgi:hypothetical protein
MVALWPGATKLLTRRLECDKSVVSVAYPDRAGSRSQRTRENKTLKMLWIIGLSHSTTVTGIEDANCLKPMI